MHIPVLLNEVLEQLDPKPGQKFIDATINGGGHTLAIIERIRPDGKLLGFEWDDEIFKNLKFKIEKLGLESNVELVDKSYVNLKAICENKGFMKVDGVLFDFGMSSWHIEESGRGFSFFKDEPLDMRYDSKSGSETAAELINKIGLEELVQIIRTFGEERFAGRISEAIITARKTKPITSTFQFVEIIKNAVPFWYRRGRIHYATRTFQALRIAVNHELENIEIGLKQSLEIMKIGGRVAAISFHSLEDRVVKNMFRNQAKNGRLKLITKKPIIASLKEIIQNPRARSAKLRVAEIV